MFDLKEIEQNLAACEDKSPLTEEELTKMQEIRDQLGNNFCRRCNYCAPCAVGIAIPNVFLFQGYLDRYGLGDWAKDRYHSMPVKASACIGCGACEKRCPYDLPIREMLKDAAAKFGE
jgi:predicted aldo/keto reductase-like oxidoreductase